MIACILAAVSPCSYAWHVSSAKGGDARVLDKICFAQHPPLPLLF